MVRGTRNRFFIHGGGGGKKQTPGHDIYKKDGKVIASVLNGSNGQGGYDRFVTVLTGTVEVITNADGTESLKFTNYSDAGVSKPFYHSKASTDHGRAVNKPSVTKKDKANQEPLTFKQQQEERKEKVEAVAAPVELAGNAMKGVETLVQKVVGESAFEEQVGKVTAANIKSIVIKMAFVEVGITTAKLAAGIISPTHAAINYTISALQIFFPEI